MNLDNSSPSPGPVSTGARLSSLKRAVYTIGLCVVLMARCQETRAGVLTGLHESVAAAVTKEYPDLFNLYQYLHTHPELSFHEQNTSTRIADELRKVGFTVTTNVGGFGVVAVLTNGSGP